MTSYKMGRKVNSCKMGRKKGDLIQDGEKENLPHTRLGESEVT